DRLQRRAGVGLGWVLRDRREAAAVGLLEQAAGRAANRALAPRAGAAPERRGGGSGEHPPPPKARAGRGGGGHPVPPRGRHPNSRGGGRISGAERGKSGSRRAKDG